MYIYKHNQMFNISDLLDVEKIPKVVNSPCPNLLSMLFC